MEARTRSWYSKVITAGPIARLKVFSLNRRIRKIFCRVPFPKDKENPIYIPGKDYNSRSIELLVLFQEVQHLPRYPSEILPLFLYLGEKRDACNAALNYDLKINCHVILGENISPIFPGKIESLHINIRDLQDHQLPCTEIYRFIG